MSVLDEIVKKKIQHVEAKKAHEPLSSLQSRIKDASPPLGFLNALKASAPHSIIAEIKKASPSAGVIRKDFDPVQIAQDYEQSGATCLSILTDEPYFQGSDAYFKQVKAVSALPMLRKDFMVDEYQIYESRALGADCILLIMAALSDSQVQNLYDTAANQNMDILVEIHNTEELERALTLNPELIGINNRNLKTLEVDLQTSHNLADQIPPDIFKISESGIKNSKDIKMLQNVGYQGFLIGETLMKEENIRGTLKKMIDTERELK